MCRTGLPDLDQYGVGSHVLAGLYQHLLYRAGVIGRHGILHFHGLQDCDLVTGLVTGLLAGGMEMPQACLTAARASRITGLLANPTPATQIAELLPFLPEALRCALEGASPPARPSGA